LLDRSEDEISGDILEYIGEEEEGEGKEELRGMLEDQDNFDPEIMRITNKALPHHSSGRTAEKDVQDFEIQHAEELDQVDADFNNIA
jgi:hypothetical protein